MPGGSVMTMTRRDFGTRVKVVSLISSYTISQSARSEFRLRSKRKSFHMPEPPGVCRSQSTRSCCVRNAAENRVGEGGIVRFGQLVKRQKQIPHIRAKFSLVVMP